MPTEKAMPAKETTLNFTYSDAVKKEGGGGSRGWFGGADAPAFQVTSLKVTINTTATAIYEENLDEEIVQITGSVRTPRNLDTNDFDESFLNQHPSREVYNLNYVYNYAPFGDGLSMANVTTNFDPVAKVKILDNPQYDFQAYQTSSRLSSSTTDLQRIVSRSSK